MSRIGTFPDDDVAGWVLKSPELGRAIGAFAKLWVSDEHWAAADRVMNRARRTD